METPNEESFRTFVKCFILDLKGGDRIYWQQEETFFEDLGSLGQNQEVLENCYK